jgi:hypothetical protein
VAELGDVNQVAQLKEYAQNITRQRDELLHAVEVSSGE